MSISAAYDDDEENLCFNQYNLLILGSTWKNFLCKILTLGLIFTHYYSNLILLVISQKNTGDYIKLQEYILWNAVSVPLLQFVLLSRY